MCLGVSAPRTETHCSCFREFYPWLPQFSSVQLLSRVRLFVTPWITARQASLSITNSRVHSNLLPSRSQFGRSRIGPKFLLPPPPTFLPSNATLMNLMYIVDNTPVISCCGSLHKPLLLQTSVEFPGYWYWDGNRQEGQGSPSRGNRLQVSLKIPCFHDDTRFHQNLTFLKTWANQCVVLMEMFFLRFVNAMSFALEFVFLQNGST